MKVVSNASPLIFLSKLNKLELLSECFGEIHIPQAVKVEIGDVALPEAVTVTPISEFGKHYVAGAVGVLHIGELEAIRLTEEINANWVILDDLRARQKAQRQGLSVIGTIGVLKLAQAKGLFDKKTFTTDLDALVNQHGMWLSAKLLRKLKE